KHQAPISEGWRCGRDRCTVIARGPPSGTAREEMISTAVALMSTILTEWPILLFPIRTRRGQVNIDKPMPGPYKSYLHPSKHVYPSCAISMPTNAMVATSTVEAVAKRKGRDPT